MLFHSICANIDCCSHLPMLFSWTSCSNWRQAFEACRRFVAPTECYCPVPESVIAVWAGVAPPPTLTVTVAVLDVAVVGRKVALMVQLAPMAKVDGKGRNLFAPHVLVCANWFVLVPPSTILLIGSGTVPVFVRVTVCAALVVLIAWFRKDMVAESTEYVGRTTVPVSGMVADVAGAATLMVSVWLKVVGVVVVGRNVTFIVQPAPLASGVPKLQLLVCRNCPRLVPPKEMLLRVRAETPVFVTVIVWTVLVVFSGYLKAREVGVAERTGVVPVPLSATNAIGNPGRKL
jgi:hypothetical protein